MYRFRAYTFTLLIAFSMCAYWEGTHAQKAGSGSASPSELAEANAIIDGMFNRSIQLRDAGRYAEAAQVAEVLIEAIKLAEPEGGAMASALQNLALIYQPMERHLEAEKLFQDAIAMGIRVNGPNDTDVAIGYANLANYYREIQAFAKADENSQRGMAIMEKVKGADAPELAVMLTAQGASLSGRGRYADSEPVIRRAIKILERQPATWNAHLAAAFANLAIIFKQTGRFNDAEGLYKRAGAIWEQPQSQDRKFAMENYSNLGNLYRAMGRYAEAEQSYKTAVARARKMFGRRHSSAIDPLGWLADLYRQQKRFKEARKVYRESDAIIQAVAAKKDALNGSRHSLAMLDIDEGRAPDKAEAVILGDLPKLKALMGAHYSPVGEAYQYLGLVEEGRRHWPEAADRYRQSIEVWKAQSTTGPTATGGYESEDTLSYRKALHGLIESLWHVESAGAAAPKLPDANPQNLQAEAFEAGQRAINSTSAAALAQMARRHASGDSEVAKLIRESQDLDRQWLALDRLLSNARAAPTLGGASALEESIDRIEARRKEIAATVTQKYPQESELTSPAPLSLVEAQKYLKEHEALVTFLLTDSAVYVWIVSQKEVGWQKLDVAPGQLAGDIRTLRCGLDAAAWQGEGEKKCQELLATTFSAAEAEVGSELPFDLGVAHDVYQQLFGPVEALIKDKSLLIVPSGALSLLPFEVLVTEAPAKVAVVGESPYRRAKWLGTRTAITVLPSISSLKALRAFAKQSAAKEPFLGIGNPLLDGDPQDADQVTRAKYAREWTRCVQALQVAALDVNRRGEIALLGSAGLADAVQLRRQLPLPETVNELCAVGRSLGVSDGDLDAHVRLGAGATENEIKALSAKSQLANYRIVHFATHAALSGQVRGSAEPGLILTPPATASDADDGYLSATEVAQLKLDADWVILSACNTAAGDSADPSALSGLARGFLYAGARSLLVSYWAVDSESTVNLITSAFAHLNRDPSLGRAAAMRLAITDLIERGEPYQAHPAHWAPFVLVGEGAGTP